MNDKSEALRLAVVVDAFDACSKRMPLELYSDISSELRRLHEVNQELLEALRGMLALDEEHHQRGHCDDDVCAEVLKARAAIAKATGEQA